MAMTGGTVKPVHTGYANYGAAGAITLNVYYKISQDVATNKSTVYTGMYVTTPSSSYNIGPWSDSRGSYVGTTSDTFDGSIPKFAGTRWLVENKSFTVTHDAEGKATATIYWKWGVNSPWGQTEHPSGSFTITLPTIARASTITSVADANIGSTTKVVWTPRSKSFYYKLKLSIGDWKYTTPAIFPQKTTAYTYTTETIPYSVGSCLASDSKKGTMTATLYTYSDSACTKQVGSATSKTFTVTLPENSRTQPTVFMDISPVNTAGKAWESVYVQGISKVKATFSGDGIYGATISQYKMKVGGMIYSTSPYTSGVLANDKTMTVTGYAIDSRGFTGTTTQDITVLPYGKPKIAACTDEKEVICARCKSDGTLDDSGTYLRIKAMRSFSKLVYEGTQHNFCALQYRYKVTDGSYSSWKDLLTRTTTSTDVVDVKLADICSSVTHSYVVQLRVQDDVSGASTPETFNIPTDAQDFHLKEGGGGAAFGKYSEMNKTVEIAEDWELVVHGNRWKSLGISSNVTAPDPTTYPYGRADAGTCSYRVENGNHVYVQISCGFTWAGNAIVVSGDAIPSAYRPPRDIFSYCATTGKYIVKLAVSSLGKVVVSNVQDMSASTHTDSATISWIDGYIDYFI